MEAWRSWPKTDMPFSAQAVFFADLVFMRDALRLAIHLKREVSSPIFCKVVHGNDKRVSHVARLQNASELRAVEPYLKEAYHFSRTDRG